MYCNWERTVGLWDILASTKFDLNIKQWVQINWFHPHIHYFSYTYILYMILEQHLILSKYIYRTVQFWNWSEWNMYIHLSSVLQRNKISDNYREVIKFVTISWISIIYYSVSFIDLFFLSLIQQSFIWVAQKNKWLWQPKRVIKPFRVVLSQHVHCTWIRRFLITDYSLIFFLIPIQGYVHYKYFFWR